MLNKFAKVKKKNNNCQLPGLFTSGDSAYFVNLKRPGKQVTWNPHDGAVS
jgi:secreted PhoX family phosphatase